MNRNYFVLIVAFIIISCGKNEKSDKEVSISSNPKSNLKEQDEGYTLLKNYCYACHSVTTKSHDDIIAPPLIAIKRRYKSYYGSKEEFVNGITNWATSPKEENALMRGAVMQFKVMPKLFYKEIDIRKIATYIYDNELEKPKWFESHFNTEHPNGMNSGMGKGNSKGIGRGRNRNNN